MWEFRRLSTTFSVRLDTGHYMLSFSRVDLFNRGKTRADLKCEGKEASESDKLTIDVIGVTIISMRSFTKQVGIGSKSDDLHGDE